MLSQQQVKAQIPHTWPLFFARHGRFTPVQQQAIPSIMDGRDALVIAATASGKTEAVLAPLLGLASGRWSVGSEGQSSAAFNLQPHDIEDVTVYGFRPSVLVQQIFSLIKQSPTGSVRLADLHRLVSPELTSEEIRQIISQLTFAGYLQAGRLGEWKPGEKLQTLIDQHEIYSNIGAEVLGVTAIDAHTGRTIAHTDRPYPKDTVLLYGGKPMRVVWVEKYRFGLAAAEGHTADDILHFQTSYAAIPFVVTQAVARSLGIEAGQMAVLLRLLVA